MAVFAKTSVPSFAQADGEYRQKLLRQTAYFLSAYHRPAIDPKAGEWLAAEKQSDYMLTLHPRRS